MKSLWETIMAVVLVIGSGLLVAGSIILYTATLVVGAALHILVRHLPFIVCCTVGYIYWDEIMTFLKGLS